jgi:hypothetical protein
LKVRSSDISFIGWTPFLVALHRRHWDTARLVLAIAKAQYQPDAEVIVTTNLYMDYPRTPCILSTSLILRAQMIRIQMKKQHDSDEDDYSDYDEQQKPINFTDIAARPSSVRY